MILTTIDRLARYASLNPRFPAAFDALQRLSEEPFTKGRKEVDGEHVFVNCAQYDTLPSDTASMEFHKRYIDVMWMISGEETIGIHPTSALRESTREYDAEGDYALARLEPGYTRITMKPGTVAILFPEDAHAPGLQLDGVCNVQKLIAKVQVD